LSDEVQVQTGCEFPIFQDRRENGVWLTNNGLGTFEDNEVFSNGYSG